MRPGVSVFAYDEQGVVVQQASSDQNGVYAVLGLPAGRYKVLASTVRGSGYGGPQPLDQWYSQAADFTHGAFVDVRKGDTTRSINFNLLPGGSIVCQVLDRFGVPLSSGMVYLCDARGARIRSASVLNGNCAFGGLTSGQYKLFFSSPRSSEYASEWLDGKNSAQDAALITVTAPGSTQYVNFTLQPAGSLGGYVADAAGTRITDRLINVILFDAVTGGYVGVTQNILCVWIPGYVPSRHIQDRTIFAEREHPAAGGGQSCGLLLRARKAIHGCWINARDRWGERFSQVERLRDGKNDRKHCGDCLQSRDRQTFDIRGVSRFRV